MLTTFNSIFYVTGNINKGKTRVIVKLKKKVGFEIYSDLKLTDS